MFYPWKTQIEGGGAACPAQYVVVVEHDSMDAPFCFPAVWPQSADEKWLNQQIEIRARELAHQSGTKRNAFDLKNTICNTDNILYTNATADVLHAKRYPELSCVHVPATGKRSEVLPESSKQLSDPHPTR